MLNITNLDIQSFITNNHFISIGGSAVVTIGIGYATSAVIIPATTFVGFTVGVAETTYRQVNLTPRAAKIIEDVLGPIADMEKELFYYHSDFGFLPELSSSIGGGDNKIRDSYNDKITKTYNNYFKDKFSEIHNNDQCLTEDLARLASEVLGGLKNLHQKYTSSVGKVGILSLQYYKYGMKNPTYDYLSTKKIKLQKIFLTLHSKLTAVVSWLITASNKLLIYGNA